MGGVLAEGIIDSSINDIRIELANLIPGEFRHNIILIGRLV